MVIMRSQLKNERGIFLHPPGFEPRSPVNKSQCATNELLWPPILYKVSEICICLCFTWFWLDRFCWKNFNILDWSIVWYFKRAFVVTSNRNHRIIIIFYVMASGGLYSSIYINSLQSLLFSATAATAAIAAVKSKRERHLVFQVTYVNFPTDLKLSFFQNQCHYQILRFDDVYFLNNLLNISMIFK